MQQRFSLAAIPPEVHTFNRHNKNDLFWYWSPRSNAGRTLTKRESFCKGRKCFYFNDQAEKQSGQLKLFLIIPGYRLLTGKFFFNTELNECVDNVLLISTT